MKFLVFLLFLFTNAGSLKTKEISFKKSGAKLTVEVADTFSSRNEGLMHRTSLPKDRGMLFIFNSPQRLSFWMKNTYIPLSIAYLDKNKVIKEIHQMKPQSMMEKVQDLKSYPSQCQCLYALEVNQGWFKKNKVKVGDSMTRL